MDGCQEGANTTNQILSLLPRRRHHWRCSAWRAATKAPTCCQHRMLQERKEPCAQQLSDNNNNSACDKDCHVRITANNCNCNRPAVMTTKNNRTMNTTKTTTTMTTGTRTNQESKNRNTTSTNKNTNKKNQKKNTKKTKGNNKNNNNTDNNNSNGHTETDVNDKGDDDGHDGSEDTNDNNTDDTKYFDKNGHVCPPKETVTASLMVVAFNVANIVCGFMLRS